MGHKYRPPGNRPSKSRKSNVANAANRNSHTDHTLPRVPTNYTLTECTDTNSTMSDIPGPGRLVGSMIASAGSRLEQVIDRFAERQLGLGPNMAAIRLIAELHAIHIRSSNRTPECKNEHESCLESKSPNEIALHLIWVCNGICSQCRDPYIPDILEPSTESLKKAMLQLASDVRVTSSPPSNVELGSMYLRIIAQSRFLPQSLFDEIGLVSLLEESVDHLQRISWSEPSPPPALSMLKDVKAYILASPYDSIHSWIRLPRSAITTLRGPDTIVSSSSVEELVTKAREMNDWSPSLVGITRMCTSIHQRSHNYSLDKQAKSFSAALLTEIDFLLNCPELPDLLIEYVTSTRLVVAKLESLDGAISNELPDPDSFESDRVSPDSSEPVDMLSLVTDTHASEEIFTHDDASIVSGSSTLVPDTSAYDGTSSDAEHVR